MQELDINDLKKIQFKKFIANFIIPLMASLISIGLIVFVIYPNVKDRPQKQEELQEQTSLANQLAEKTQKLNDLTDFKDVVIQNTNLVEEVLVTEALVPELLTQIDIISKEAGLSLNKMSYSTASSVSAGASYDVVVVNLGVEGSLAQLISFLNIIENSGRVIVVDNVRYSVDPESGTVSATIVLSSPYVRVESEAAIDDPITFDISSSDFQKLMSKVKSLKVYKISAESLIDLEQLPNGQDQSEESAEEENNSETADQQVILDETEDLNNNQPPLSEITETLQQTETPAEEEI